MWDRYGRALSFECNDEFDECRTSSQELKVCSQQFDADTEVWCDQNCPDDFDVQAQLIIDEDTVAALGAFVTVATIGEGSADVGDVPLTAAVNVPADTPCTVDSNDSGNAGPVVVTTAVEAAAWTDVDGLVVLEATFVITAPVPITLSTKGDTPACTWGARPMVTLTAN